MAKVTADVTMIQVSVNISECVMLVRYLPPTYGAVKEGSRYMCGCLAY